MKKWAMILVAAFAATTFAACGGGDNNGHSDDDGHDHCEDGDHKDDNDHEKMHDSAESLGDKTVDGYKVSVKFAYGEKESGAMIAVEKDGKPVTDADVYVIVLGKDGKQIGDSATSTFMDDHKDYDAHIILPKDHAGYSLKVRVKHGEGAPKEVTFKIE